MALESDKMTTNNELQSQGAGYNEEHISVTSEPHGWGDGSAPSEPSADDQDSLVSSFLLSKRLENITTNYLGWQRL
jgi:hypothetical protein